MSKVQFFKLTLTALNIAAIVITFTAKAFLYVCIALYCVGELLFSEYASKPVTIGPDPELEDYTGEFFAAVSADVWEEVAPVTMAKAIAVPTKTIAVPTKTIATGKTSFHSMKAVELRKTCQCAGVTWRNAHGRGKHLSRSEMLTALLA